MGEIHCIDSKIQEQLSEDITLKHGTEHTFSEIKKLTKELHSKEFLLENLKNDVAKLKYQQVNLREIIDNLNIELNCELREMENNSNIISEYDAEFKKGVDELSKKTNVLDRLNNKLQLLIKNNRNDEDDNNAISSPLEHTISHLSKDLKKSKEICNNLQKEWIIKQTELVNIINDTVREEEFVTNLNCKETILNQKKIRLLTQIKIHQNDIRDINTNINNLRLDTTKLNKHINEYTNKYNKLLIEFENMEIKYENDLIINREKSTKIKNKIKNVNKERESIIENITNLEKQILLWERKIELETETRKTLDPNYGKSEINDMEREIHRMENRLNKLKRKQDDIIKEMELSINKKEMIQLRNLGKYKNNINNKNILNKKCINKLKTNISLNIKDKKYINNEIDIYSNQYNNLLMKLKEENDELNQLNNDKLLLQQNILKQNILKKVYLSNTILNQKLVKDINKSHQKTNDNNNNKTNEYFETKYQKQLEKFTKLKEKIKSISKEYPQYQQLFNIIIKDDIDNLDDRNVSA